MAQDAQQQIYFGTEHGIDRMKAHRLGEFEHFVASNLDSHSLRSNIIYSLNLD